MIDYECCGVSYTRPGLYAHLDRVRSLPMIETSEELYNGTYERLVVDLNGGIYFSLTSQSMFVKIHDLTLSYRYEER